MGIKNIKRLKKLLEVPAKDKTIEKYLTLIDKVYYEYQIYCEEEDKKNNTTWWIFQDGTKIEMNFEDICRYLLICEILEESEEMFI